MAYDEKIASRVRRILARRRDVVEKKMMGGLAFLVDGAMCCSVSEDALLVRIDADERDRALAKPHVTTMQMGGRTMSGFVRVAAEGIRTEASLTKWIERGIAAGAAAKKPGAKR